MTDRDPRSARKDALLEAVLPNVLFDGWSILAMQRGADSIDMTEAERIALFPGGADELREWLDEWADARMVEALHAMDLTALRQHERIAAAVRARLAALAPHKEAVRRALAARFSPAGPNRAARAVYRTVDLIWFETGDASTDFSFYSKRAILAGVYGAAVLYWLADQSEDAADTASFIERRLADVVRLPKEFRKQTDRVYRETTAPFRILRQGFGRR